MTRSESQTEAPTEFDPYSLPGAPEPLPDPPGINLGVFELNDLYCTATSPESARRLFEDYCCEVVSPKDVVEVHGEALNKISHTFGVDIEPYEWWWSARMERNRRIRDGEMDADFLVPANNLPPVTPRKGVVWTECANGENSPPSGEMVWTSDGFRVRRGIWHAKEPLCYTPEGWQAGEWRDRHGDPLHVIYWEFFDKLASVPTPPIPSA